MNREIIINSSSTQTRVAITEESKLVDFFVENPEKERMVGDIYLGRVARVLPGIKAAFIDIGLKHDAFLHFSDVGNRLDALQTIFNEDDETEEEVDTKPDNRKEKKDNRYIPNLKRGQEILIQILKEPVKNKGVRVTSSISIPGRFCVLLPFDKKIGISKKINDFRERRRLKKLARDIIPENFGLIIRTAAKEQTEEALKSDINYLMNAWNKLEEQAKSEKPPSLIYKDLSTTTSVIRDLFTSNVKKIFVDSKKMYKEIRSYISLVQPSLVDKVDYFRDVEPIFEVFGIEKQIKQMMGRKVPLPSGGHIVIEHTEAMNVIDVNSGSYAKKKDQELNSLKTDLEAAREIVRQLRLRDIGGLVVIDFIDLEDDKNRKKIYDELKKEFKRDRAKIAILPMTEFGLIQITRQRIRENILQSMNEVCPYCHGSGLLTKQSNLLHEIEEWLKKYRMYRKEGTLLLKCNPHLASKLREGKIFSTLTKLQFRYFQRIKLEEDLKVGPANFKIYSEKTGEEITDKY